MENTAGLSQEVNSQQVIPQSPQPMVWMEDGEAGSGESNLLPFWKGGLGKVVPFVCLFVFPVLNNAGLGGHLATF